jgi:rhodanese-related sulfurtransferase
MTLKDALNQSDVKIIDVRSVMEFQSGHVPGSVNIPLNEIPQHLDALKSESCPLILCCASGSRSAQAVYYLQENGVKNAINGGGWMNVQFELSQSKSI